MIPTDPPLLTQFGEFVLDEGNARLARNGEPVELAPKAFSVLCVLVRQPGQLVVKDALLDAVWGHQHVSESVLKTLVSQLRSALQDDARQPRYIETASRRGYRFIFPLTDALAVRRGAAPAASEGDLVGRAGPLSSLHSGLALALSGKPQVMLVAGEPGIGKTTLIDRFVAQARGAVRIATGQCVEHYGGGEPYMPVLEALNLMCRDSGDVLVPLMRSVAPTWLTQLPWHLTDQDRQQLQREVAGATQDRMMRELGELLDRYTADHALLLVLEDLHWSDPATIGLLGYLARRRSNARLMLLGSFRLTDIIVSDHPLKGQRQELRLHGLCTELDLEAFSETEVRDLIRTRFPGLECPDSLVRALHDHTEGLPLFVASMLEELLAEGVIKSGEAGWFVEGGPRQMIPQNIAGLIEKQINRLPPQEQAWLAAASVAGVEFLHAPLADALQVSPQALQTSLDALVKQRQWLRSTGAITLADGRISARYSFVHALHRHVFYRTLGRAQRMTLHRSLAGALQLAYGEGAGAIATELAMHFERGSDLRQAVTYLRLAAAKALERSAMQEALAATRQGVALLAQWPDRADRLEFELDLQVMRGVALTHLTSYSSPDVAEAFGRAQALCDLLPENPARARALHGMWWVNFACADLGRAHALALRVVAMGEATGDGALLLAGHSSMGLTLAHTGDFEDALRHFEHASAAYERIGAALPPAMFLHDPGVELMSYRALVMWWTGRTRLARSSIASALGLAEQLKHPLSRVVALHFSAVIHFLADEPREAREAVERIFALAQEYGMWRGPGGHSWVHGWALAREGRLEEGLSEMNAGKENCLKMGMLAGISAFYVCQAEVCVAAGMTEAALEATQSGLAFAHERGDLCLVSPMWRLRGQALLQASDEAQAVIAFTTAAEWARKQGARHFEVEALLHLARVDGGKQHAALRTLRAALATLVHEENPSLAKARALALAGPS